LVCGHQPYIKNKDFIKFLDKYGTMVGGIIDTLKSYALDIIVGIIILLVGFGLGILAKKVVRRVLKEIHLNRVMSNVGITHNIEKAVTNIVMYLIYLFTIIYFLDYLGITSVVVYLIAGAILALLILTLLVGLKDVIPNFFAWIILQRKGKVIVGRRVDVKEISGVVEKIGYLETEIKTEREDILYVPNSLFLKTKFWVRKH
jgi:small conductance mechanosensitive channel